jgi:ferredoxin, 2Fe-2S
MSTLTIQPVGITTEVTEGTNLQQAILAVADQLGDQFANACAGDGHLFVLEGRKGLSKMTPEENAKLDAMVGVGSKSRLASLITVLGTEPVKVELLGALSGG